MNNLDTLAPMRSVTPFIAVPFPFCGNGHVLLEGNGRLKAMKMAAAEDADLADMSVEVTLLGYTRQNVQTTQEGIELLWNQYVNSIEGMNATAEKGRIEEYSQFKVGMAKCVGVSSGLFGSRGPCPITDSHGQKLGEVPVGELFGYSRVAQTMTDGWGYEMCGGWSTASYTGIAFVHSSHPGVVEEFCPKCVERTVTM
jgi:hypothetical protein